MVGFGVCSHATPTRTGSQSSRHPRLPVTRHARCYKVSILPGAVSVAIAVVFYSSIPSLKAAPFNG